MLHREHESSPSEVPHPPMAKEGAVRGSECCLLKRNCGRILDVEGEVLCRCAPGAIARYDHGFAACRNDRRTWSSGRRRCLSVPGTQATVGSGASHCDIILPAFYFGASPTSQEPRVPLTRLHAVSGDCGRSFQKNVVQAKTVVRKTSLSGIDCSRQPLNLDGARHGTM